jgi:hypothetical protein
MSCYLRQEHLADLQWQDKYGGIHLHKAAQRGDLATLIGAAAAGCSLKMKSQVKCIPIVYAEFVFPFVVFLCIRRKTITLPSRDWAGLNDYVLCRTVCCHCMKLALRVRRKLFICYLHWVLMSTQRQQLVFSWKMAA